MEEAPCTTRHTQAVRSRQCRAFAGKARSTRWPSGYELHLCQRCRSLSLTMNHYHRRQHMKSRINSDVFTRSIRITLGIFSLLAAVALATPHTASAAGTAANAKIVNTVTVNYKDLNNNPQAAVTSSTTVTVLLVK